ncbi:ATP-binding protein [Streptomyces sp. NBC_00280]|uniref:ATP-binding protein n=1 Tax=Streptomyces sp. NBC_00280 TaxID=2975699 RepID=UPI003243C798
MNQRIAAPEAQPEHAFRNFSVRLSPTPRGARLARLLTAEQLRSWDLPLDPARQIVAELAANAVTHGRVPGRDFRLTVYVIATTLRIEVTDTCGDRPPCPQPPSDDAEFGRGLALVEALADRWGWGPGLRPRKTVWAEIDVAPEPDSPCPGATSGLFKGTRGERKQPNPIPSRPPETATTAASAQTHSPE